MIDIKPQIEKPYSLSSENIGEYLKELKQTEKIIERYDFSFERASLCSSNWKEKVLDEIQEQIKLCEHYFITKKRKDLNKWIFQEKVKPQDWNEERDIYSFFNGLIQAKIEIFKREKSTEIVYGIANDSKLYVYYDKKDTYKNLRSEKSIKVYIEEVKEYLEEEINKVGYDKREQRFYDFIFNTKNGN